MSDPLISQTIGNYEILDRIGKGGMATVYRARQLNMRRDVAVKIMSADLAEDPEFVARFEREAHMIASLEHPRIVPVHDFGLEGDLCYLVMRLVEGETLYHRLRSGPIPLQTAARYMAQIGEALDYAHAEGVIHRDLKPNNILIDRWDNLYLMDFGLAKLVAATQSLTQTGTVLGTPAYMAPEQWRGEPVDARTDVYALGVILYEMVLGRTPFESDTPFTLMYKHINDPPPLPRELLPDLPEEVEAVILKALAKNKEDRYQSAGALARAFGEVARVAGSLTYRVDERPAPGDPAGAQEAEAASGEAAAKGVVPPMEIVPPPAQISPPPPPIPVPVPGDSPVDAGPISPVQVGGEMPPDAEPRQEVFDRATASQALREAVEVVDRSLEAVVEKAAEAAPPLPGGGEDSGEVGAGDVLENSPAYDTMRYIVAADDTLVGVLDVRGTARWRLWKQMLIGGLALNIIAGLFNAGLLSVLGWLVWVFLFVQVFRTWRGDIGRFYLGFTAQGVTVLPRDGDDRPLYGEARMAAWGAVERLRLTNRHVLLDMPTPNGDTLSFAALIVAQGSGGLGDQLAWLPDSALVRLIAERGFEVHRLRS